jgi:hypothetical protein
MDRGGLDYAFGRSSPLAKDCVGACVSYLPTPTHTQLGMFLSLIFIRLLLIHIMARSLDYNEAFRDMLHICVINEHGIEKFKSTSL